MAAPAAAGSNFAMHVCTTDGIVYDVTRNLWYGFVRPPLEVHCPTCGMTMDGEPRIPPHAMHFCFHCGITFDPGRKVWYGIPMHMVTP